MFNKHSKAANGGQKIGFIKPAKTRMAGRMIAIMRMIRLQYILEATTISAEFRRYVEKPTLVFFSWEKGLIHDL